MLHQIKMFLYIQLKLGKSISKLQEIILRATQKNIASLRYICDVNVEGTMITSSQEANRMATILLMIEFL